MGRGYVLLLFVVAFLLPTDVTAKSYDLAPQGPTRKLKWTWNPLTPQLPSYPCPRTEVPVTQKTLWIDGAYNGTISTGSATQPYTTVVQAWRSLVVEPKMQPTGITFNIRPGLVPHNGVWTPLQLIWATADNPIVFQRDPDADPSLGPAIIEGEFVFGNSSYIYFKNVMFKARGGGTNVIRVFASDYIYFLNCTVMGNFTQPTLTYPGTSQALKVYNSRAIYVEDSDVYGTAPGGWSLTYINVQYGHVCRSHIHHSDWCFGLTGGSAYILMDGNNVHHCGQAALVAGMSSGPPTFPWVNYDAYDIKVTNNIVHEVWGAGLSVWGGYNILMAHNTLYRVGSRSHTIEFHRSTHGCPSTAPVCAAMVAQGAWVALSGSPSFYIPSKNIMFLNNLIVNPVGAEAMWAHFATDAAANYTGVSVPSTLPNPVTMHEGLIIKGNVFVNRHADPKRNMILGLDICYGTGLPCDRPTVYDTNLINAPGLEINFTDPETLVLTEASKAALSLAPYKPAAQVPFADWSTPVDTPVGRLSNEVPLDRAGVARRAGNDLPGAYYDPNYQPAKFCSIGPNPSWAPNSTASWPAECGRVLVGSVCTAACGTKATGVDYTARCDDNDTWTFLGGGCTTKVCASAPSAYLAPSASWDQSCAGALIDSVCKAECSVNATGTGYVARCDDTNTWTVVSGVCQGPPWKPSIPVLPSYPCPRTQVPSHLTPKVMYVDPSYNGTLELGSAAQPYKTFAKAWNSLGKGMLKAGVTMNIRPGTSLCGRLWMDGVWGTPDAPLIIQRDPAATAADPPSVLEVVDIYNCTYLYFKGITFTVPPPGDGNAVHLASCSYVYLLNVTIAGVYNKGWPGTNQALKVNQVMGLYVEDSDIYGSGGNGVGLDGVAVQYGHVCRSTIHHADWCMYLKGGSAYFIIDSNTVYACGQAGLEVGQGTGFEYMVPPWLEYEGYGMKLTNNLIYDVWGAGLGVNGGYSILIAHDTLYRVGSRSHTVEIKYGGRGCGGSAKCGTYYQMGGWGPALQSDGTINVPTKDVMFLNNLLINPKNESAMWCHFATSTDLNTTGKVGYGPTMPNPLTMTQGFVIRGNVFVNWHRTYPTMSLCLGPCEKTGLPCDPTIVTAVNLFNTPSLQNLTFADPETLVLTEASKAALRSAAYKVAAPVPYDGWSTPMGTPQGQLDNAVPFDRNWVARGAGDLPGAWV